MKIAKITQPLIGYGKTGSGQEYMGKHVRIRKLRKEDGCAFALSLLKPGSSIFLLRGEFKFVKAPARLALETLRGRLDNRI